MSSSDPTRPSGKPAASFASKPAAAPAAKPASPYARFIPREELGGFAAWKPGDLSAGEGRASPVHKAPPPAPPQRSPEELLAEHVRNARTGGYQDGYRDGLAALDGFKQSYATQVTAQVGAVTNAYCQQLEGLQQQMAHALAVAATNLARQMVRTEIRQRPELVATVAQEAVDTLLLSAKHITVRVHPDDLPLVAKGAADVLDVRGARLLSDDTLSRGGCVVESDIGAIDASLETRWRRAAASLGIDQAWDGDASGDPVDDGSDNETPA
jgi:flagellar assembly protein FliH